MDIVDKVKQYAIEQRAKDNVEEPARPRMVSMRYDEYRRLKAIEGAAVATYDHFAYLSRLGSLARDDDEVVEELGKALLSTEDIEERVPTDELKIRAEIMDIAEDDIARE